MAFEDYNINQFVDAWFKNDRSVMTDEVFKEVYTEYIDTAGLFEEEEFNRVSLIHYLNGRINSINLAIKLQRDFINTFYVPFLPDLGFFKKFGHILFWKDDREKFIDALNKIEQKEKKYISQLEGCLKELKDARLKKNKGEVDIKQSRVGFIKTLNSLGKIGYKIDRDKTTVEELAFMIKQQFEEMEQLKSRS